MLPVVQERTIGTVEPVKRLHGFKFKSLDLTERDDQEIPTTARWIEERQGSKLPLKGVKLVCLIFRELFLPVADGLKNGLELGLQIVKEKRLDHLHDVAFAREMRP